MMAAGPAGGATPATAPPAGPVPAGPLGSGLAGDLAAAALAMARRFHAGATLWCAAPGWEPHAHHMAVEFVHPVIMGKRALPAFALTGPGLAAQARVAARSGDILIAIAGSATEEVADLVRRAPAWGALTIWIGSGPRPATGAADHVLWIDDPDPMVPATGRFVLLYHLLWELTHVCFGHPGLLGGPAPVPAQACPPAGAPGPAQPAAAEPDSGYCVTCRDEGRLAEVISAPAGPLETALVRTPAGQESVDVTLVAPVAAGDLILVHAGTALARPVACGG